MIAAGDIPMIGMLIGGVANAAVALVAQLLSVYQTVTAKLASRRPDDACTSSAHHDPFVSVHVATHSEPPALVIATLDALAVLDYPAFEVIIIDNNTPDEAIWRPVAAHAAELGSRFRFYHREGVQGAKAGALNIALDVADLRTAYVAVVDADYHVSADFLRVAISHCARGVDFVQFPQAYRRCRGAEAIVSELRDYFKTFPSAANRTGASLLTGTLSLISITALRRVGGWPSRTITEDAELGVALWTAGAQGRYVDRVVGHGLLPLDLSGLRQQRARWVAGNMQTLLGTVLDRRSKRLSGCMAVAAQLTAWASFLAVPLTSLVILAVFAMAGGVADGWTKWTELIAVGTIAVTLVAMALRSGVNGRISALGVTMSMMWTSSFGWLPALFGKRLVFHRTPKGASESARDGMSIDTAASFVALATAIVFAQGGAWVTAAVLAVAASGLLTALGTDRALRSAARAAL